MALGYCKVCDKLVSIRASGYDATIGGNARAWYPVAHVRDTDQKNCPGDKRRL